MLTLRWGWWRGPAGLFRCCIGRHFFLWYRLLRGVLSWLDLHSLSEFLSQIRCWAEIGIITGWCWKFATAMFHPTQSTLVGTLFKRQVYLILGLKPPARSTLPTHQLPSAYCLQAVIANPVEHFRFAGRAYDLARHTWRWKPAKAETRASSVWSRVSASVSEGSWCFHRLFPWFFLKMRIG